jgi:hypothetical protein
MARFTPVWVAGGAYPTVRGSPGIGDESAMYSYIGDGDYMNFCTGRKGDIRRRQQWGNFEPGSALLEPSSASLIVKIVTINVYGISWRSVNA